MTRGPAVRYPAGPITPHGAYHVIRDRIPQMALRAYDDSVVFNLMGGLAIPDRTMPERVEIKDLKGLVPPWQTIDQKGATEDGVTFVDALYDPIEPEMIVKVHGRDPAHMRAVHNHLMASLDAKLPSELSFFTQKLGRWWAPVRWFKTPPDSVAPIFKRSQEVSLRLRADNGFWQSYPDVAEFRFAYATASDDFETDDPDDLGTGWTIGYSGAGSGTITVGNGQINNTLDTRRAVARKNGYTSATNNQVVEIEIGTLPQWWYPFDAFDDAWARMANSGTPGVDGIRVQFMQHLVRVSRFNSGVETIMREQPMIIPPIPGTVFTVVAGVEGDEHAYKVMRGGATFMNFRDESASGLVGSGFRSAGLGLQANSDVPASGIRRWSAGDNSTVSQNGWLRRINVGDQPMWDRYTCFGPGTFRIANGHFSDEYVEFGPLLPNQVMQIRTDPRKYGVVDMTSVPPSTQELTVFQQALQDFLSFASGNNLPPLFNQILSNFGIAPPQGNPFSLLHGRFSHPIPARSPGRPVEPHWVRVAIDDGNADSKVLAAGTPLRRFPY